MHHYSVCNYEPRTANNSYVNIIVNPFRIWLALSMILLVSAHEINYATW